VKKEINNSGICEECGHWTKDLIWEKEVKRLFRYKTIKVCHDCKFSKI